MADIFDYLLDEKLVNLNDPSTFEQTDVVLQSSILLDTPIHAGVQSDRQTTKTLVLLTGTCVVQGYTSVAYIQRTWLLVAESFGSRDA